MKISYIVKIKEVIEKAELLPMLESEVYNDEVKYSVSGTRGSNIDRGDGSGYNSNSEQIRTMWTLEDEVLSKREVASFYTKISEMAKQGYSES